MNAVSNISLRKETDIGLLPPDWKLLTISEVGEVITGTTPKTADASNYGEIYMFIRPPDIDNRKYVVSTEKYLSEKGMKASRPLPADSVLVTCIGNIGRVALTSDISTTNQQINSIITNEKIIPDFLYYNLLLRGKELQKYQGKTVIPIINKGNFSKFLIPIPDRHEQKIISDILTTNQISIEKTQSVIDALQELKKSMMQHLFTYGPVPLDEVDNVELKETEIGMIPAHWEISSLNDLSIKITDGAHASPPSQTKGFPMASVKNMTTAGIDLDSCRLISNDDYDMLVRYGCKPLQGDVLVAKDGSIFDKVCLVEKEKDMVLLSSIAIIRPCKSKILSKFLYYYLISSKTREYMRKNFTTGSAIRRIVLKDLKIAYVELPSLNEQEQIVSYLDYIFEKIALETRILEYNKQLFNSFLSNLMSGNLRVNELEV